MNQDIVTAFFGLAIIIAIIEFAIIGILSRQKANLQDKHDDLTREILANTWKSSKIIVSSNTIPIEDKNDASIRKS